MSNSARPIFHGRTQAERLEHEENHNAIADYVVLYYLVVVDSFIIYESSHIVRYVQ